MKKSLLTIFLFLSVSCLILVSCNPDVSNNNPTEPVASVTQSLKGLEAGGSIPLENIGEDTEINLSDFSLEDGVYIEIVSSKGKAISASKKVESEVLFQRQDGTIIPIPDEEGKIKIKGKDLGLFHGNKVIISRLPSLDDDFQISVEEYQGTGKIVAEEYYYYDLSESELDPKEIVLVTTGSGAHQARLLQQGFLNREVDGIMNLSQYKKNGFAVNLYLSLDYTYLGQKITLHILNPIDISKTNSTSAILIKDKLNVLKVKEQDSNNKKIVIVFNDSVSTDVIKNIAFNISALITKPRHHDGFNIETVMVPEYDLDNKTIIYHLGEVDETFIFTLNWEETDYSPETASIYLDNDNTSIDFYNVSSSIFDSVSISSQAHKIVTWPFKSDSMYPIYVENNLDYEKCRVYFINDFMGSGFGHINEFLFNSDSRGNTKGSNNFSGYVLLDCTDMDTSEEIITLSNSETIGIECDDVVFDSESGKYKCQDPTCNKKLYSLDYLAACAKKIFEGHYSDPEHEIFGEFGEIPYFNNEGLHSDTGIAVDGRRRFRYVLTDGTEHWIELRLQEISKKPNEDKKIVYDVYWYGKPDTPTAKTVIIDCEHDWQDPNPTKIDANHYLIHCQNCGSTRLASVISFNFDEDNPDTRAYKVDINAYPSAIYIYFPLVPKANDYYEYKKKSSAEYTPLEDLGIGDYTVYALVFSLNPGKTINISDPQDDTGYIKYTVSFDNT